MRFGVWPTTWAVWLSLILGACLARATTIDPLTWEQLVLGADFVGVVECTQAGGIVARYRVMANWGHSGPAVGEEISIQVAVNYYEPQFPIALVGERFLVTAYKNNFPSTMMSTTMGGAVPLWFRSIPSDYGLPLFQGRIDDPENRDYSFFGSDYEDFASFRDAAVGLLGLDEDQQEAVLLRALAKKYMLNHRGRRSIAGRAAEELPESELTFIARLDNAHKAAAVLDVILNPETIKPQRYKDVLIQGGGAQTLSMLESHTTKIPALLTSEREYIAGHLRMKLYPESDEKQAPETEIELSDQQIQKFYETFLAGPKHQDWTEAFTVLTEHKQNRVADWLLDWRNPDGDWREDDLGYELGSFFAWRCSDDRIPLLSKLAKSAKDDYVRVAAAVYLTFDDEEAGITQLNELKNLPGDPGAWAALTLARRGDKAAVPRLLEVLSTHGQKNMTGAKHRNLQKRVLVLLSNSCAANNIPFPKLGGIDTNRWEAEGHTRAPLAWWLDNQDKITLHDPWLPMLIEQKVD